MSSVSPSVSEVCRVPSDSAEEEEEEEEESEASGEEVEDLYIGRSRMNVKEFGCSVFNN